MNIYDNPDEQKLQMIRQIMDTSLQPLLAVNHDGSIVACNDALCGLMGMSRWEIENLSEAAPDFHQCLKKVINDMSTQGYCYRYEKHCKVNDGRKLYLDISIFKVTDSDGQVKRYYASLFDITPQKVLERDYRLIAENAYDLITIIDHQTYCYKYVSPSHKRVMGFSAEELIGKFCFNDVHPDDRKMVKDKLLEGIKQGSGIAQYRTRRKDSTYVWLEAIGRVIDRSNGQGDVLLVTREINEKKLAELALKASEEKYRLIVDNAYDGISIIDANTFTTQYINPSLLNMLGYSREERLGKSTYDIIHEEEREAVKTAVAAGLIYYAGSIQCRLKKKDGSYIWAEVNGRLINPESEHPQFLFINRDISERKRAEALLRESEEKYRLIVDNAYDGISIVDPATMIPTFVNPPLEKMLDYSLDERKKIPLLDQVCEEDRAMVEEAVLKGMLEGEGRVQCRLKRKDGSHVWTEVIGKVMNKGTPQARLLFINRDINERKNAEEMLRRSEGKYRLIADNTMDIIALIEPDRLRFTYLSPSVTRLMGYSENELIGTEILPLVHPEDLDQASQSLFEGLAVGCAQGQYRARKKDGTYVWLESIGKIINDIDGRPAILLTSRNIDRRKRGEKALMASEERLRRSEAELKQQLDYLNYLINNMNEIFVLYNNDQQITFVNSSNPEPMGYRRHELIGQAVLGYVVEQQHQHIIQQVDECIKKSRQAVFETVLIRKDGSEALVRIKSSPIIDDGEIRGGMLLIEDISEHRKLEKQMARLDQLNTVGEMAAGIGHEIRNPMTAVKGFLQMLSQYEEYAHHQHYFQVMLEELERANSIISEFLSLAKNKLVDRQPHNLNVIIRSLFPLLQVDALLTEKALVLQLSDIPELLLDEKEIRQLIVNLVRNGMEAMEAGGTVAIVTGLDGDDVILEVQDEGKGIAPDMLERLGTPFFTTKDNGTGLGLAICYSIVARHGGAIEPIVRNNGTTIQVRFKVLPYLRQMGLPW
ncbi:MAG: PAS domain S-box protein [Syntrophomonadaceae bacterium]